RGERAHAAVNNLLQAAPNSEEKRNNIAIAPNLMEQFLSLNLDDALVRTTRQIQPMLSNQAAEQLREVADEVTLQAGIARGHEQRQRDDVAPQVASVASSVEHEQKAAEQPAEIKGNKPMSRPRSRSLSPLSSGSLFGRAAVL